LTRIVVANGAAALLVLSCRITLTSLFNHRGESMRREAAIATTAGTIATAILAVLIVIGSRRLSHFDAALVGYTFATLFAAFGITYRYAIWLQRPPTWMYWKRGWQLFLDPRQ
jgi:hypothetical protein